MFYGTAMDTSSDKYTVVDGNSLDISLRKPLAQKCQESHCNNTRSATVY